VGLSAGKTKQRLRLPKRLKAGTYTVKFAFKASGTGRTATGTTKVSARR
jgi:methionine-rich copper-binding protein CopC